MSNNKNKKEEKERMIRKKKKKERKGIGKKRKKKEKKAKQGACLGGELAQTVGVDGVGAQPLERHPTAAELGPPHLAKRPLCMVSIQARFIHMYS